MSSVHITINGHGVQEMEQGAPLLSVVHNMDINGHRPLAVRSNGQVQSLSLPVDTDIDVELITFEDEAGIEIYRHSTAHVLAQAVKRLWPEALLAIGPPIRDGFYYDIRMPEKLSDDDLPKIEKEMKKIAKEKYPIERVELSRTEALALFEQSGDVFKVALIRDLPEDEQLSCYKQGEFIDLCRGPHVPHTGYIRNFKLLKVAGAYWRGDEKNEMLTRIYGTSWDTKEALTAYCDRLKEAEKRDHRKLGAQLDIFSVQKDAGPGLIFWHPHGAAIRNAIEDYWRQEHLRRGWKMLYIPHIMQEHLWATSGHLENYADVMYGAMTVDDIDYRIKPMNCPGHILIYKSHIRSYRDLPLRWCELGTVYRYEKSGQLHGLLRVRGFTQDDAHVFCTEEQIVDELANVCELVDFMMRTFDLRYTVMLSTRPEKAIGDIDAWDKATDALKKAVEKMGWEYSIDEGGGAFYGPKLDFILIDALGREWQGPTVQADLNLPGRFNMEYIGPDGKPHVPLMIHRALLGSIERFVGVLIEHFAGKMPPWCAPVQVKILTVNESVVPYAKKIEHLLEYDLIRVETDYEADKIGKKIRTAQLEKVPFMLIVGDTEVAQKNVSVRHRTKGDIGIMSVSDFQKLCKETIDSKALD